MKKIISILIIFLFLINLAGCVTNNAGPSVQANANQEDNENKTAVVTTIFSPYDFVREIAGGQVELSMLLPPGTEVHSFEPTPQDIIKIQNCDLFIYVGGESDEWVRAILDSMDTSSMTILSMMDTVETVKEEIVEGMEHDEEEYDDHAEEEDRDEEPEYDEHVWTSPKNAKLIVSAISSALCRIDNENQETYQTNAEDYLKKLDELDAAFQDAVDNGSRKTIVFGDRFPFRYFADAYGLDYYAAFPGCSSETEPSAKTVAFLIDIVKKQEIPVIFHIEFSNGRMADAISESTGAKKLLFHSCHNVSPDDIKAGTSYLELMNQNVKNLEEALR